MQIPAPTQRCDLFFFQLQVASKMSCVFRQALAVSLGIRIAAFDAQAQRTQDAFGGLKFVGEFFQLQQRLYSSKQFFREDWLAQKIVSTGLDATDPVFPLS